MSDQKLDTRIRREQIVEAALDIVASQGVRRLSVAAVARRVGLVPSGIYRHFRSKDEILSAVLDLLETRITANVQAACDDTRDPMGRLKSLLVRHARFIREGRAMPRIIFSDDVHSGHPERRKRIQEILSGYLGRIAELVRDGQRQGLIRRNLDPQTVSLMFFGMIVPAGLLWHLTEGGFDVTRHTQRAWQLFHRAISLEGAPR